MAPEMMKMMKYDEKVDIFSFGIVLCEVSAITLLLKIGRILNNLISFDRLLAGYKLILIFCHEHPILV